jgi:threonine/homoserine/homoserine lactone efflux protein
MRRGCVTGTISSIAASLGVGLALAGAPGPVQAVLLAEAVRGGVARGFRAFAGVHLTFGFLVTCLALGLSFAPPSGLALRVLKVAGGALLVWLAVDGYRSGHRVARATASQGRALPPAARGMLAIILNPGGWLFLGAVASPLVAAATQRGGTGAALGVALALVVGAAIGDGAVVLLGGIGVRRGGDQLGRWVGRVLAALLAVLGVWLLVSGIAP